MKILMCMYFVFSAIVSFSQTIITENQEIRCEVNILSINDDSIRTNIDIINKSKNAIYLPKYPVGSGVQILGKSLLQIHIGWNQISAFDTYISLQKILPRDTLNLNFNLEKNSRIINVSSLQMDINYLDDSNLNKIEIHPDKKILFSNFMSNMNWYQFFVPFSFKMFKE